MISHILMTLALCLFLSFHIFGSVGRTQVTVDTEQIPDYLSTHGTIKEWAYLYNKVVNMLSFV